MPTHYYGYLPFGELMVEHNNSNYDNVYKFNGKELDPQTGYYYYGARYYDPTMSVFLSVDPLAESQPNKMPYHYVSNNPINRIDPTGMLDTDYYNLNGNHDKHVDDGKTDKKLVLTTSSKAKDVDSAINKGHVVNQITNSQLSQMDEIFNFGETDKTGREQGFMFGQGGNSSETVTGKTDLMDNESWAIARANLREKGDIVASDAHLHPFEYDNFGNVINYGLPIPSIGNGKDTDPKNNIGYTQPSMIFGFNQIVPSAKPGQIGGSSSEPKFNRAAGFYNTDGLIIKMDYSRFKSAIKKMNK